MCGDKARSSGDEDDLIGEHHGIALRTVNWNRVFEEDVSVWEEEKEEKIPLRSSTFMIILALKRGLLMDCSTDQHV